MKHDATIAPAWAFRAALKRQEAAALLSVSEPFFDKLVEAGIVPKPVKMLGAKRWSRRALDEALERLATGEAGWGGVS